mmetsp:Transcript_42636/g.104841  ORF Transcript_42636/g.104841 Transcript_42636/m.104841 type:complete len:215 (-) Transcript_42636:61-705(-)
MMVALHHLKRCGVIHADIKPDNMVVNAAHTVCKLCDFGCAFRVDDAERPITQYLVSRFYRAPEIILQLPYEYPLDMWSMACCFAELYTGKILFQGANTNHMLRLHIEVKGMPSKRMLRHAKQRERYFDDECEYFLRQEPDPAFPTRQVTRPIKVLKPTRDLLSVLLPNAERVSDAERDDVLRLRDLLEKMFTLDPSKRITPTNALNHPFLQRSS